MLKKLDNSRGLQDLPLFQALSEERPEMKICKKVVDILSCPLCWSSDYNGRDCSSCHFSLDDSRHDGLLPMSLDAVRYIAEEWDETGDIVIQIKVPKSMVVFEYNISYSIKSQRSFVAWDIATIQSIDYTYPEIGDTGLERRFKKIIDDLDFDSWVRKTFYWDQ